MAIFSRGFSGRPRESNPDLPPGQFLTASVTSASPVRNASQRPPGAPPPLPVPFTDP